MTEKWKLSLLAASSILAAISWISSVSSLLPNSTSNLIGMVAAGIGVIFIAHSAITSPMEGVFGIDVLATVAVFASIAVGEYIAAVIVVLMLGGGEVLEDYAFGRASKAIQKLVEASPKTALVIREGKEVEVPVEEVKLGETVVVRPGGMIPVDGRVLNGKASVNQSSVTGESMLVEKSIKDTVYSGTLVELGALEIEATAVGEDSTYGRIIRMVREAEEHRAPIERAVDRYAKYFTPIILVLGVIVYLFTGDILRVAAIFVIACPCSLTLATPTAVVASIGNGARKGILIRNGESLEKLSEVDILALDKTGTITTGRPEVLSIKGFGYPKHEVLSIAASAERLSEHPVAKAVLRKASEMGVTLEDWADFEVNPGMGVRLTNPDGHITVGNKKMLEKYSIPISEEDEYYSKQDTGRTVIYVARGENVIGLMEVSDTVRPNVKDVLTEAKTNGIGKTVMLTGDNKHVAEMIGRKIGIDEVGSDLLPSEKVEYVQHLKDENFIVAMVGDGINDAPALATADVGIAMGIAGTDVALETAGIVLSTDSIERIPTLLRISKATICVIKQNLVFAMAVNLIGVGLSIYGLVPPLIAAMIHESNALAVMLNSLRLLNVN